MNETPATRPACPYVGLVPFTEADAPFFFGRDADKRIIASNLMASRLTLLYGASGVGKSSVLRAGVVPHLQSPAMRTRVKTAVVVFSDWSNDPIPALHHAIAAAVRSHHAPRDDSPVENSSTAPSLPDLHSLPAILEHWSQQLDGKLLIILDQFEEFFLYHGHKAGPGTFLDEFPQAVNRSDLRVGFLISIREDALAKLDIFKGDIPNIFDNDLRIEHLDRDAARQAIEKPLEKFNALTEDSRNYVAIDAALIDAVLDQVQTGRTRIGQVGRGGVETESSEDRRIEAPYLQLVLTRLWDEEHQSGSHRLRLETLNRLGGAKQIVRTHLDLVMQRFDNNQRRIVARVFDRLVTPSGTKIAMSAPDLASRAQVSFVHLQPVLEQLAGPKVRILRAVPPPLDQPHHPRFEIFHDVLAASILDWQTRFNSRRHFFMTLAGIVVALVVISTVSALITVYIDMERDLKQAESRVAAKTAQNQAAFGNFGIPDRSLSRGLAHYASAYYVAPPGSSDRVNAQTVIGGWSPCLGKPFFHDNAVIAVTFSHDGATVLTGSEDNTARLWDTRTGAPQGEPLRHEAAVVAVAFSPDGTTVLTGSVDNTARLWDVRTGAPRGKPLRHDGAVWAVAFSPDNATVLTGSEDNSARIWDARTGAPLGEPMRHEAAVVAVAFSPNDSTVLTGSKDKTARLWGTLRTEPLRHDDSVRAVAFSPDGAMVLTGSDDKTARRWDAGSGLPYGRPLRHEGPVVAVAFSPDSATVLTGSWDQTARLWDARTGTPRGEPLRHEADVMAVAFSPNGATAVTGSWDQTARLWDARTGARQGEPLRHEGFVVAVAFSPDGARVLTGSEDHTARLWDVPPPALDDPERLKLSVELRTTWTFNEQGLLRRLTQAEWLERRKRLDALGGPCDVVTWEQYRAFEARRPRRSGL